MGTCTHTHTDAHIHTDAHTVFINILKFQQNNGIKKVQVINIYRIVL